VISTVIGSKFRVLIKFLNARKGGWGRPQDSSPSHNQSFPPSDPLDPKGSSDMGLDMGKSKGDWVSTGFGVGFVPHLKD
jgi:hypothetical protein